MNINIALLTLIILIITILYQIKVWKLRALLSPGFYFSLLWILGVVGLLLFNAADILVVTYPQHIDELNILVGFTGLCFISVTKIGAKKINTSYTNINYIVSFEIFKVVAVFYFFIALIVFWVEGSGLDFITARDNLHATIENRNPLVGYFRLLSVPLSIYAGSKIIKMILNLEQSSGRKYFFLILPFISNTLFSLAEGGRVSMVFGLMLYIIGAVLTLPKNFQGKGKKKLILYGVLVAVCINAAISWIGNVRGGDTAAQNGIIQERLGTFSFLYGGIEYVTSSYIGYQYRREDAVDENLGYGKYTFNGFINWQLPFSSRLGLEDASIAKAFDIFYFNQETYDFRRDFYYVTHSAYIPIMKDFGYEGAFIAIFFIVLCSHYFFVKIQKKKTIYYSVNFFFYYLFLMYWAKSNFYGTLSESVLSSLYGLLIIDFLNSYSKRNNAKFKVQKFDYRIK